MIAEAHNIKKIVCRRKFLIPTSSKIMVSPLHGIGMLILSWYAQRGIDQKHVFLLHVLNKNHKKVLTALYAGNWVLSENRKK